MVILLLGVFIVVGYFLYQLLNEGDNSTPPSSVIDSEKKDRMNSAVKKILESPYSDEGFEEIARITGKDTHEKRESKIKDSVKDIMTSEIDKNGMPALVSMIKNTYAMHNVNTIDVSYRGNELIFNCTDIEMIEQHDIIKKALMNEYRYSEEDVFLARKIMKTIKESDLKSMEAQEPESRVLFLRAGVKKWTFQIGGITTSTFEI